MSNQSIQDNVLVAETGKTPVKNAGVTPHPAAPGTAVDAAAATPAGTAATAADSGSHQSAAALVAAAVAAAAEQAEALAALKKLTKEEALRMFETQNPARRDAATEQIVENAVALQLKHGTKFAAAYLEEHKVPLDVGKRVLLMPSKRRSVRPKR